MFQVSGRAIRLIEEGVQVTLLLDFLPDFDQKGLEGFLRSRQEQCPYKSVKQLLIGLLPQKLAEVLMMGKPDISGLAHKIKEFPVEITGSRVLGAGPGMFRRSAFGGDRSQNYGIQKSAGALSVRRDPGRGRYLRGL